MGLKKLWKWLPLGDKDNFSAAVLKLMFSNDTCTPVIVSGNIGIFTMVMSTFQQYEKAVSRCIISWQCMQQFRFVVSG